MIILRLWLSTIFMLCVCLPAFSASPLPLISTESDPDAFIQDSVNVINGDYCEAATDLVIAGPDALVLQRFYSARDAVAGKQTGGWRILPQRFLVVGKGFFNKSCAIGEEQFQWSLALTGERSGGILPYTGWRNTAGLTKAPLTIDAWKKAIGIVNTYAKEINGQTNHLNNVLRCKDSSCELLLGDGTKRVYTQVQGLPSLVLGEELTPLMAAQVIEPQYYLLTQETLPSGNHLFFSYDTEGHLLSMEIKNKTQTKVISWIHFSYDFQDMGCQVLIETSDAKTLIYRLSLVNGSYWLVGVEGSHLIPVSYKYQEALVKKILPEGRFTEIEYEDGKVKTLKGLHPLSGQAKTIYSFSYAEGCTDVFNAAGVKTRYLYDSRFQLSSIERYDDQKHLYRTEQRFWGNSWADSGLLLAKSIGDGNGRIHSYRSFHYDKARNVIEERLYGNLTGKQEVSLQVSPEGTLLNPEQEECHTKSFGYSEDGFNLLTKVGDGKGNQTLYHYQPGTNLLIKKFIYDQGKIKKRTFHSYTSDGVCIRTIEDDGSEEDENKIYECGVTERHVTTIHPKMELPGVGLPVIITESALDLQKQHEILIRELVNTYDEQSNLISCDTYNAAGQYVFSEKRAYNAIGQVVLKIDSSGKKTKITYDANGNELSISSPDENRYFNTLYDFHNQPIEITETDAEGQFTIRNAYDALGRKISSTDRFGNSTLYEYDAFDRLTQVIHPEVLNENNQVHRPAFNYTYDIFGNVLTIQDPQGFTTSKSYNLRGDPTKVTYPDGSFELFKYDTEGSLHRSLSRDQIITVYEYDYLGRVVYEESSTAGETGVSSFASSRSHQYNGFRCTFEREDNLAKKYTFGPAGRLTSVAEHDSATNPNDPESRKTEFVYGPLGRIRQKKVWFDVGPADYCLECYQYDRAGNILKKQVKDAEGHVLLEKGFSYNSQNQCIEEYSIEDGNQTTLKTAYNSQGEPISYLDAFGQETRVIIDHAFINVLGQTVLKKTLVNPIGVQTEIEFDALGRVYSISKKDSMGILLSSQKILYDCIGNKACEIHDQIVEGNICSSQKRAWNYGPNGRLEEEIEAAGSPLEKRIRYSYNSAGKMVSKTIEGSDESVNYTYNKDGRLHKIEGKNKKKELKVSNSYSYDRRGNITSAHCLHGKSVERSYNTFNQVIGEIIKDGEGTYILQYSYDKKGRTKEINLPDNSKIAYVYDALFGRAVKRISSQGETLYTHTYDQYDSQGKLLRETHIGDVGPEEYTYDLSGQKVGSKNIFFDEKYTWDTLGRLLEAKGRKDESYSYNSISQLVSEKKTNSKTYAYDSLDNRVKADQDDLVYNALNQLTSHSRTEFSYDSQGNLLRKVLDGEETQFESNILSQLISIGKADKTSTTFSYDPFGRLLVQKQLQVKAKNKKTLSTTRYLYIGHQEIGKLDEAGQIETLKVPGIHGEELSLKSIAFEINGQTYAPIHDIAGNVISLIDPQSRQIVEIYEYTAFGEGTIYNKDGEVEEFSIVGNPWRFAEKRFDDNTGLILFGLRFYDPSTGRWISKDPAGLIDGPNLYAYLHNNPLNYQDRFGLATEANSQTPLEGYLYGEVESHCYCEKHRTCKRGGDIGKTRGSQLPKIRYCDSFEKHYSNYESEEEFWATHDLYDDFRPYYERSKTYDLSGEGVFELNDMGIGFINGIDNTFDFAKKSARYISKLAGGCNVHAVYNATHGISVDLKECKMGLDYIATEPVRQLHKMWNSFFEKSSANAKFLMICHSQGAIHVRNALLDYPPELRKRILVVAIAPGAYIYEETCAHVIHYRAESWWRDFVPRFDGEGKMREKNTTVNLQSDPKAPFFDHEFMSHTYRQSLREQIHKYIKSGGR